MDRRDFIKKATMADALIVGTPVYYGQPNGGILSLMHSACSSRQAIWYRTNLLRHWQSVGEAAPTRDERPQFMNFIR